MKILVNIPDLLLLECVAFFMMFYLAIYASLIAKEEFQDTMTGLSSTKAMKEVY